MHQDSNCMANILHIWFYDEIVAYRKKRRHCLYANMWCHCDSMHLIILRGIIKINAEKPSEVLYCIIFGYTTWS
jgi:hypothetical protein